MCVLFLKIHHSAREWEGVHQPHINPIRQETSEITHTQCWTQLDFYCRFIRHLSAYGYLFIYLSDIYHEITVITWRAMIYATELFPLVFHPAPPCPPLAFNYVVNRQEPVWKKPCPSPWIWIFNDGITPSAVKSHARLVLVLVLVLLTFS